jgi:hypothetical protein
MTYNRQKAIKEIRQACIADDSTVSGRSIVLKDVLKSVPMEDGSFDRLFPGSFLALPRDYELIRLVQQRFDFVH